MHVVFDMDGVLLDSESDLTWLHRALDETLRTFDIEVTQNSRELLYPTNLRDFDQAANTLGVPPADLWPVRHRTYVREKNAAIRTDSIGPFADVEELPSLANDASISIISNSPESVVETFVESADLDPVIDHIIGRGATRDAVEHMKPATTFFERLEGQAKEPPAVYIGDASSDALFAQRTGMDFLHLDREAGALRSISAVVSRLSDRV
ncbi:HAD family hydrolase [Halodesulfurarchaeum sp.]|uniref:HAD family hydrolase n=1 Tax=Halodesulfurarchaeum sp. TaxID=1980530 RepID=UPI001BC28791|nr:HAD hydrolase-like protein [Halodesulfurarchaeum sp.]